MSFGSTAYASYVRIHVEMGKPKFPSWDGLSHVRRMAWEAAAQAVAKAVLPSSRTAESFEVDDDGNENTSDED